MTDKGNFRSSGRTSGNVVMDVNVVTDSCRDKDCFDNIKVFLTSCGQDVIEQTSNVRVKETEILWTSLTVEQMKFSCGFYSIGVRFFTKLKCEGCICGKAAEFEGLAVCDKKVVLYGGDGSVSVFRSGDGGFCSGGFGEVKGNNLPYAVCEVACPVALELKVTNITEESKLPCDFPYVVSLCDLPEIITSAFDGQLEEFEDCGRRRLITSLGFFSVVRVERPGQYAVNAREYCVPAKCCGYEEENPCSAFMQMDFPVGEFAGTLNGNCLCGNRPSSGCSSCRKG